MIIPETLAIQESKKELLKIINSKIFDDKVLFEKKSAFHDIKVVENEVGRFLHYASTYQAGFIDTEFYKGNLPYINYFLLPYFYKKNVKKVLLIGLGTGKIVGDLFKIYPEIKQFDICDIEENSLEIAKMYFGFKLNAKTNFYLQDGIIYLRTTKQKYDLIIVDVANNDGIDERFLSADYFFAVKSHLKKDGIFVSNLCASADLENPKNKFYKKLQKIYSKEFNFVEIYKGNYSDKVYYKSFFGIDERVIDITNLIFLASDSLLKRKNYSTEIFNFDMMQVLADRVLSN